MTAIGKFSDPPIFQMDGTGESRGNGAAASTRPVYFGGHWIDTPVFTASELAAGTHIPGPSIVEYADACAVLPPGCTGKSDGMGNLHIAIGN